MEDSPHYRRMYQDGQFRSLGKFKRLRCGGCNREQIINPKMVGSVRCEHCNNVVRIKGAVIKETGRK